MQHPVTQKHRENLKFGQRAADRTRNTMGSWGFVIGFLCLMAVWAIVNSVFYVLGAHGKHGFDPYPYILLNLMLSMMAGLQGAILLIAAKRQDAISSALAEHDYRVNEKSLREITDLKHLMTEQDTILRKVDQGLGNQAKILQALKPKPAKRPTKKT